MPKKDDSPCRDCEFRNTYCHANCEVYKAWAEEKRNERKYTAKENASLNTMWDYGGKKYRKKK